MTDVSTTWAVVIFRVKVILYRQQKYIRTSDRQWMVFISVSGDHWFWRWLPLRLSKRQSLSPTVLFRTTLTRTITLDKLKDWPTTFGKFLAGNRTCFYSRQQFSKIFANAPLLCCSHTQISVCQFQFANFSLSCKSRFTLCRCVPTKPSLLHHEGFGILSRYILGLVPERFGKRFLKKF